MSDDDLKTILRTAADRQAYQPVDATSLIQRADRIRRRRRWGAGATVALVLGGAFAAPAAFDAVRTVEPPVAGGTPTAAVLSGTPMPSVGRGDAALEGVDAIEAIRRCTVQWTTALGRPPRGKVFSKAALGSKWAQPGGWFVLGSAAEPKDFDCSLPGDTVPSAADRAAVEAPDVPSDEREVLRRCSARYWHDITGWTVVGRSHEPGLASGLVAVSPSGKYVASCFLTVPYLRWQLRQFMNIKPVQAPPASVYSMTPKTWRSTPLFDKAREVCDAQTECRILLFEARRMPLNVAKLRVRTNTRTVEVPVHDGWFVYTIGRNDASFPDQRAVKVEAIDTTGRSLGQLATWPLDYMN
ncbi:hypothetical protein [Kribbella deserti]|uniref:Uncharacterized protein n=1 Tax=Kribbella deserti TaxID=1926257 RepID=A0ABV6QHL9_9ACTN